MELPISQGPRNNSSSNKMVVTRQLLMEVAPKDIFEWDVEMLDTGLKEMGVTIGITWSKPKKANKLNKSLMQMKSENKARNPVQSQDPNSIMMAALQTMPKSIEAIAEKVSETTDENNSTGGSEKCHAKTRHQEKLEQELDFAKFLRWENSWNLYLISDD